MKAASRVVEAPLQQEEIDSSAETQARHEIEKCCSRRQAIEDARHAKADAILYDERHATFVIPGARGRTHFFTADGRLVSSVRYGRDALERKRKLGLWRGATPEQVEALLQALAGACLILTLRDVAGAGRLSMSVERVKELRRLRKRGREALKVKARSAKGAAAKAAARAGKAAAKKTARTEAES